MRYEIDAILDAMWEMDGYEVQIMGTAMFSTPIWTILSVVIYSSKNKVVKVDNFVVILGGI